MAYRVLTITPWFPNYPEDGRYNFILNSVEALRQRGNQLALLVTRPWTPRAFGWFHSDWQRSKLQKELFDTALGIQIQQYISLPRNYCHYAIWELFRLRMAPKIESMAREISAQVIHAHTELAAFAAVPVARKLGIPVVVTLHGINMATRQLDTQKKKARLRKVLAGADQVVLVGEPLRDYFVPLAGGDDNFCVVPNGFFLPNTLHATDPQLHATEPQLEDATLRLISISNLHEGKGIDLSLKALAELSQRGLRDWHYTIVGDGAERSRLEEMVDRKGLRDRVVFLGHLPHLEALSKLANADVFLLPSYREAFGVAYLEAMASGLLTIGVKGQGPEVFIQDGETGFLVHPLKVEAIAERLEFIMRNKEECRRIAGRGGDIVTTEFTWERHAEKLMTVYSKVMR